MTQRRTRSTFAEPLTKELDWDIELQPVQVESRILPNHQALVRNDNGEVLSVTKKSYHPATNEKFLEVISRLHEFTGFAVEGYSVFQGGRKVLAFLKNQEKMRIGDFDSENYMVVGNSFDCSSGFFTGMSNVVIRCTNQFSQMNVNHNIRHNQQITAKLDELVLFYESFMTQQIEMKATFDKMNKVDVSASFINEFVNNVLNIKGEDVSTMKENHRKSLMESIGNEMDVMGNNAYGLFNGLTHYTTHVVKSSGKTFGNSLGHSYRLNERGYEILTNLINL